MNNKCQNLSDDSALHCLYVDDDNLKVKKFQGCTLLIKVLTGIIIIEAYLSSIKVNTL